MFEIRCATAETLTLPELKAFQGALKKRTDADIDALMASIQEDGLLMPFAVWQRDGINNVLDGHARMQALSRLAGEEPEIMTAALPVIYIDAPSEARARASLLQITSSYGRINTKGLRDFVANINDYRIKAPMVVKVLNKPIKAYKQSDVMDDEVILKLRIKKMLVTKMVEMLKQVDGVVIL